jgi:PAS domain S-box-containing protein
MVPSILLIAPNSYVASEAEKVISEGKKDCVVVVANLEEGLDIAKNAQNRGFEAIISRGGTYKVVKKAVKDLPVVEINVSAFDILAALDEAVTYGRDIGIIGYNNIVYDAVSVGKYFNLNLWEISFDSKDKGEEMIKEAALKGKRLFIGDTISVELGMKYGMNGILIKSGRRAIFDAIKEAERIIMVRRQELAQRKQLEAILGKISEGVIAIDDKGVIRHFNPAAERIYRIPREEVLNKPVKEIFPEYPLDKLYLEEIYTLKDTPVYLSKSPINIGKNQIGSVSVFQKISDIQEVETKVRRKLWGKGHRAKNTLEDIKGDSLQIKEVIKKAYKYSRSNATVMIYGDTGVGKEILAQGIHNASNRAKGPFVAVNCAAFSESLLESELFGYVEGSFTDARKGGKVGLFELASGGSIFLDEIAEMSPAVQAKLLRVIQEREVIRLGDDKVIPIDIRIICATNKNLWDAVKNGKFREDLYYRVNVLTIKIPPLAERKEDIPILARHMLEKHPAFKKVPLEELEVLKSYDWPGNVRELQNFIEQLVILTEGTGINSDILIEMLNTFRFQQHKIAKRRNIKKRKLTPEDIMQVLAETDGIISDAADLLGVSRTTLWRKMKEFDIKKDKI